MNCQIQEATPEIMTAKSGNLSIWQNQKMIQNVCQFLAAFFKTCVFCEAGAEFILFTNISSEPSIEPRMDK